MSSKREELRKIDTPPPEVDGTGGLELEGDWKLTRPLLNLDAGFETAAIECLDYYPLSSTRPPLSLSLSFLQAARHLWQMTFRIFFSIYILEKYSFIDILLKKFDTVLIL